LQNFFFHSLRKRLHDLDLLVPPDQFLTRAGTHVFSFCARPQRLGMRRVAMAKMKVAQVPKLGADFEIVEREIPNPGVGTFESVCRLAAFVIATASQKKDTGRGFNIRAFPDTKSPV
jgi:hypothetical protein